MYDNRKKLLIILILCAFIFSLFTLYISSEEPFSISAESAAAYVPCADRFIYLKNENERRGMASTTKIMTALIALEYLDENEEIVVGQESCGIDGSSLYLRPGDTMNSLDLIYALLLQSANDAACALAHRIAGSIEEFADLMNENAAKMGLSGTHFKNPHGLDDKDHYTTSRDLAILSAEALKNARLREISSTKKREIIISGEPKIIVNHNKLLRLYDGCIGLKTGYTKKCGRCLASAAEKNGFQVIAVTLDAPDDWSDHRKLFDMAYDKLERRVLCEAGDFANLIPVLNGDSDFARISAKKAVSLVVDKTTPNIDANIRLSSYFSAPIYKNEILGTVIFTEHGHELARVDLVSEDAVNNRQKKKFFSHSYNKRTFICYL